MAESFPWDDEPNELDFEADGLRCVMRRGPMLQWCGYVGVNADHPWFGLPYNAIIKPTADMLDDRSENDFGPVDFFMNAISGRNPKEGISLSLALRVHGGITWAEDHAGPCDPDGRWWFGFDCGHGGDVIPAMMHINPRSVLGQFLEGDALKLMLSYLEEAQRKAVYRDVAYVVSECQQLAAQLVNIGERLKGQKIEWVTTDET